MLMGAASGSPTPWRLYYSASEKHFNTFLFVCTRVAATISDAKAIFEHDLKEYQLTALGRLVQVIIKLCGPGKYYATFCKSNDIVTLAMYCILTPLDVL